MPFLAFIGRTFAIWLWRLIIIQLPFHRSCWRTSSPHFRSTVLFVFGPGSAAAASTRKSYATAQSQFLSFCRQLGRILSSGSPCPADEWTLLLVCYVFGRFPSALFHQSVSLWGESPSYRTRFCGSSSQLSSLAACHSWHQTHSGLPLI